MIEKMKFVSAAGPKDHFDEIIQRHLSKYEIHLENAFQEFGEDSNLIPFVEENPYRMILSEAEDLMQNVNCEKLSDSMDVEKDTAVHIVHSLTTFYEKKKKPIDEMTEQRRQLQASLDKILPFRDLGFNIEKILKFQFIRYRFGRIPKAYWNNFATHFKSDLSSIFAKSQDSDEYIWGVYFVPKDEHEEADAVYTSMHFERIYIPDEYKGTPTYACEQLQKKIDFLTQEIQKEESLLKEKLEANKKLLYFSYQKLLAISRNFDVRKLAACTHNRKYFIICGWMCEKDAKKLAKELESVEDCILQVEDISMEEKPPTKLNNPKFFKPFELYIKMYGLPAYNEFDPTIFVAISYAFIFGAMFGDLGQGFFLTLGGFLFYKIKKAPLGAIISIAGVFSMLFGILFGSVFGFENWIHAIWLRPLNHMSDVPLLGRLNTVFVLAIGFGMFLILLTMILNVINGIRNKDLKNIIFDKNGFAGLIFYGSATTILLLLFAGKSLPGLIALLLMFILPLILIGLKEVIINLFLKKPKLIEESKGMFFVQTFFELFEILLSYFSNTLSFIRIGAFAISHAAIMEVVLMLSGAENGSPNIIGVIIGNLIVVGLEGLIVGIQVLRLEYYELFSRFYRGTGRTFKSFNSN